MAAKSPTKPRIDGSAYDILGLEPGADAGAIKKAYHKIAREWHPDVSKHKDAKDVFAHVARAYEILTNPRQRVWYDLFMDNQIPFGSLERFQELYARGVQRMGGDLLARHRHSIGWAVVGSLGLLVAGVRMDVWRRHQRHAISRVEPELEGGATTSTTEWRPAYAVGGLLGSFGSGMSVVASGAAGGAGARLGVAAALAGALAGRVALPWVDASVRGLRNLKSAASHWLVAHSRPLSELLSAAAAVVIVRRMHPAMTLAESHLRAARAGALGAVTGHAIGRVATRTEEVEAAMVTPACRDQAG